MAWPCASKPITYALSIRAGERAREKEGKRVGAMRGRCSPRWCLRGTVRRGEEEEFAKGERRSERGWGKWSGGVGMVRWQQRRARCHCLDARGGQ